MINKLRYNDILNVFFMAMEVGWASRNSRKIEVKGVHGTKSIEFTHGDFTVTDTYFTDFKTKRSNGLLQIFYQDLTVWYMTYGGYYDERVIPLLKSAMFDAYKNRQFYGGRGTHGFQRDGLVYLNFVDTKHGTFSNFYGYEQIMDLKTFESLGSHDYEGRLLIN